MPESFKREPLDAADTEAAAWLILAEEHDAERTNTEFLCLNLLHADHDYYNNAAIRAIPLDVRLAMVKRIENALTEEEDGVAYGAGTPCGDEEQDDEFRAGRVTACLMFAAMAADGEGSEG